MRLTKKIGIQPFNSAEDLSYFFSITTTEEITSLLDLPELHHYSYNDHHLYTFKASNLESLVEIKNNFEKEDIISYSFDAPSI